MKLVTNLFTGLMGTMGVILILGSVGAAEIDRLYPMSRLIIAVLIGFAMLLLTVNIAKHDGKINAEIEFELNEIIKQCDSCTKENCMFCDFTLSNWERSER